MLVAHTGTADPVDQDGFTPLLRAAKAGDLLTLEAWLDAGAAATATVDGQTALHLLAKARLAIPSRLQAQAQDVAFRLVCGGCNPDAVAPDGTGRDALRTALGAGTQWDVRMDALFQARQLDEALSPVMGSRSRVRL